MLALAVKGFGLTAKLFSNSAVALAGTAVAAIVIVVVIMDFASAKIREKLV
jgi:ABC-type phosphate/phosphonate transport system permease subunit